MDSRNLFVLPLKLRTQRLTNIQNDCGGCGAYVTQVYGRNTIAEMVSARLLVSLAMLVHTFFGSYCVSSWEAMIAGLSLGGIFWTHHQISAPILFSILVKSVATLCKNDAYKNFEFEVQLR